jgi:hypothetical protein
MTRWYIPVLHPATQALVAGMQREHLSHEIAFGLGMVRVRNTAVDRASLLASGRIAKPHTLRASLDMDDIDVPPEPDRFVRTRRLTSAAADAVVGDE